MNFIKYIFIPLSTFFILYMGIYISYGYIFENKITNISQNAELKDYKTLIKEEEPKNSVLNIQGKHIKADLQNMKISLYLDNSLVSEYPIVSKGKPGSYYETPAGEFSIQSKTKNKFSSIGHVYMPYSMQFYGNFFLHGIPYYPDGTRVSTNYSGGCIRIADADMLAIYNFTDINTKIIINNTNNINISNEGSIKTAEANNNINNFSKDLDIYKNNISFENMNTILYSLENLNQEKYITFKNTKIKIKDLNRYIAQNNQEAKKIVRNYISPGVLDLLFLFKYF